MKNADIIKESYINNFSKALKNNEFVIYCQPKHNTFTGEITGGEALVRWISPEYGFIAPGSFIMAFEESGQIAELDRYVFEYICKRQRMLMDTGATPLPVSSNMSRVTLYMAETIESYRAIIDKYSIPFELVPIELTESYSVDGTSIWGMVKRLHDEGFMIYMDDFGAGYSSLANLSSIPFDVVKLDKTLIDGIGNEQSEELLRHIVEYLHYLGHKVVAEGVESERQYKFLKDLKCERIQGFYFNRPMPFDEFAAKTSGMNSKAI